jgi:hypothetical protein
MRRYTINRDIDNDYAIMYTKLIDLVKKGGKEPQFAVFLTGY